MRRQVVKMIYFGQWKVIHDDAKELNPYRIYKNGRKVTDYADLDSCLYHLGQEISRIKLIDKCVDALKGDSYERRID